MSESPNPVAAALAPLTADVLASIQEAAKSLPAAFQSLAAAYAPGVIRMIQDQGLQNVQALYSKLSGTSSVSTLDAIHANMTAAELVVENSQLTPMYEAAAQSSFAARQLADQIAQAALSAGISIALKAVAFPV